MGRRLHQQQPDVREPEARDTALTRQEFDELYSQEDIGVITRQSCGLGLHEAFDDAAEGPNATCARLSGAAPAKPPVAVPAAGPGSAEQPRVVSGGRLPTTGGLPVLAVVGLLLLGAAGVARGRKA